MPEVIDIRSIPALLPVGSVVTLKNAEPKPLMVYSRRIVADDGQTWDYLLCPFPEGYIGEEAKFVANMSDIATLLFIGFQNKREFEMREELLKPLEENEGTWDWMEY